MNIDTFSIYFLGTSFDASDSEDPLLTRGYEELITKLYVMNKADYKNLETNDPKRAEKNNEILKQIHNTKGITYKEASINSKDIKILVKGIGSKNESSLLPSKITKGFPLIEVLKQGAGIGFNSRTKRTSDAINAIEKIANGDLKIETVNLFGFSRGAITAIEVANILSEKSNINSINIFALDPVYGSLIDKKVSRYKLITSSKSKIKKFIGIYAANEESAFFDAVIPFDFNQFINQQDSTRSKCNAFFLPCLHETLVGNTRQHFARSKNAPLLSDYDAEINTRKISDFVYNMANIFSLYGNIKTLTSQRFYFEDFFEFILEIHRNSEVNKITREMAPNARHVPNFNPFKKVSSNDSSSLFRKSYIFSDGTGRTLQKINESIVKSMNNTNIDLSLNNMDNLNSFLKNYNLLSLNNLSQKMPFIRRKKPQILKSF